MDLQHLLTECVKRNASDLHLKAGSRPIVRVHGHLESQDDLPAVTRDFMRKSAMNMLGEIRYNALMEGEEMDLAHTVPGTGRFRINLFLCQGDVRAVLRHIPEHIPAFEGLHLPKVLERLSQERRGLILVTGITGSGKSTTLAAMLDYMNRSRNDHIVTIEDPVEFVHEMRKSIVIQQEVYTDTPSFHEALIHVLGNPISALKFLVAAGKEGRKLATLQNEGKLALPAPADPHIRLWRQGNCQAAVMQAGIPRQIGRGYIPRFFL